MCWPAIFAGSNLSAGWEEEKGLALVIAGEAHKCYNIGQITFKCLKSTGSLNSPNSTKRGAILPILEKGRLTYKETK